MSGLDSLFLYNEIPTQHMHTLKVAILEPEGYDFVREREKLVAGLGRLPPFRWRVVPTPLSINHPLWIEDPDLDLDLHVKRAALPAPGGREELCAFISEIASTPLDRTRPMWELWMVEGLANGQIAAVAKVHHSLADGHASAKLLADFTTVRPEPPTPTPPELTVEAIPSKPRLLWMGVVDLVRLLVGGVPRFIRGVVAARRRKAQRAATGADQPPKPFSGPDTSFNGVLSSRRRFAYSSLALGDARLVKQAFGGTLNDVILAIVSGTVRRYLRERDELPEDPLVAWMPTDTRKPDQEESYGNFVAAMYVNLCTDIEDPIARLLAIQHASAVAKRDFDDTEGARLSDFFEFVPPIVSSLLMSRAATVMKKLGRPSQANLIISNVRGASVPLFSGQTRLAALFSIGPVLEGVGLNITAWSYQDQLNFSLLADHKMVPDVWVLADGLQSTLEELVKLAEERTASN